MDIESRLYHYGLGARIPYRVLSSLANAVDAVLHARDLARRRRVAREMLAGSSRRGFISREKGYARVSPTTLPGTGKAIEAVRDIIRERRKSGWKRREVNPVDHLELPEHFRDHPELIDFALSDAMLEIVSDYYGLVPQLKEIGIWVTREQRRVYNSQLYHLDKPEVKIVGLFLNVEANTAEQGPLTILPADVSRRVRRATRYEAHYFRKDGYLKDEEIFKVCRPEDQISFAGGPGSGALVDTASCFHFGSRCQSGERIMMMVKFMLPHKARKPRTPLFDLVPKPTDEIRQLVLCGAEFAAS